MDGSDWLRFQLTSFTCSACGRRYGSSRIHLLAERDGLYFVDLDCAQCGSHTVAIVTVDPDAVPGTAELLVSDQEEHLGEALPPAAALVTADDVLEMHEFLSHFHGDVDSLFRAAARRFRGA